MLSKNGACFNFTEFSKKCSPQVHSLIVEGVKMNEINYSDLKFVCFAPNLVKDDDGNTNTMKEAMNDEVCVASL